MGSGGPPLSPRTGQPRSMSCNPRHPAPFLSGHTALTVSTAGSRLLPHDPQERSVRPSRGPPTLCPPQSSPRALPSAYLPRLHLPHFLTQMHTPCRAHPQNRGKDVPPKPSAQGEPGSQAGVGWRRYPKCTSLPQPRQAPAAHLAPLSCRQTSGRHRLGGRGGRARGRLASGPWARCAGPRSLPGTTNLLMLQGPTQVSPSLGRLPGSRVDRSDLSLLRT